MTYQKCKLKHITSQFKSFHRFPYTFVILGCAWEWTEEHFKNHKCSVLTFTYFDLIGLCGAYTAIFYPQVTPKYHRVENPWSTRQAPSFLCSSAWMPSSMFLVSAIPIHIPPRSNELPLATPRAHVYCMQLLMLQLSLYCLRQYFKSSDLALLVSPSAWDIVGTI